MAMVYVYAAFADDLTSGDSNGTVFWLAVAFLIVRGLWKGSETTWLIAIIFDVLLIVSVYLVGFPVGPTPFVLLAFGFGQLMILFSPTMRAHLRPRAGTGLASR
jgi:hypothetical protein